MDRERKEEKCLHIRKGHIFSTSIQVIEKGSGWRLIGMHGQACWVLQKVTRSDFFSLVLTGRPVDAVKWNGGVLAMGIDL